MSKKKKRPSQTPASPKTQTSKPKSPALPQTSVPKAAEAPAAPALPQASVPKVAEAPVAPALPQTSTLTTPIAEALVAPAPLKEERPSDAEPIIEKWIKPSDPVIPARWRPLVPLIVMLVMGLVILRLFEDVTYFFQTTAQDLGSIEGGCDKAFQAKMRHNQYARIKGIYPQPSLTTEARVMFERRNYAFAMGCDLAVSVPVKRFQKLRDQRFQVEGRLLRFREVVSLDPVRAFYERNAVPISKDTFLLMDGETPRSKMWIFALMTALISVFLLAAFRFVTFTRQAMEAEEEEAIFEEEGRLEEEEAKTQAEKRAE